MKRRSFFYKTTNFSCNKIGANIVLASVDPTMAIYSCPCYKCEPTTEPTLWWNHCLDRYRQVAHAVVVLCMLSHGNVNLCRTMLPRAYTVPKELSSVLLYSKLHYRASMFSFYNALAVVDRGVYRLRVNTTLFARRAFLRMIRHCGALRNRDLRSECFGPMLFAAFSVWKALRRRCPIAPIAIRI